MLQPSGSRPEIEEWGVSSWAATRSDGRETSCVKVVIPYLLELEELESCKNTTRALFDCLTEEILMMIHTHFDNTDGCSSINNDSR